MSEKTTSTERGERVVIRLSDAGLHLLTREQGAPLRTKLRAHLQAGSDLIVDFEGVEVVTPSYADEVLGRLLLEVGGEVFRRRVGLRGGDESVRRLVNRVLQHRAAQWKAGQLVPGC